MTAALASAAAALLAPAPAAPGSERGAARELRAARADPARLDRFVRDMPKGADLHTHLAGAVYAEELIGYGARDGDCVDAGLVVAAGPCGPGRRPLADATTDGAFQRALVRGWSMRGVLPGPGAGHDHFFATFGRFLGAFDGHEGDALAGVARRARAQRVAYVETLHTPRLADVVALAGRVAPTSDLGLLHRNLRAAGLARIAAGARADLDALVAREHRLDPAAAPLVRFQFQVIRTLPPVAVFAQLALGFELMRTDARWAGINLVDAEDHLVALRDYRLHMRMIRHLRRTLPRARVSLHAGELVPGLVPPEHLRFHVRAAVDVAGAARIGHGVALPYERGARRLARAMARRGVLVEVPLTANRLILGVGGRRHPLRWLLRHGVPVALASDDEGVLRTSLSEQFAQAARAHGLGYRALKRMAVASLRHAFLPRAVRARLLREQAADFRRFERRYG